MIIDQYLISRNFQQPQEQRESLELFKSLLQPHFLFNSLNNLYALSLKRSEQTPEAIAGLSHLLEKVVAFSRQRLVRLDDEIELINDYISLERIWLGDTSFIMDLQVKGETGGVMIPPLTIYTLVENAFKHGVRKCGNQAWVTLHLLVREDKILMKIRNSLDVCMVNAGEAHRCGAGLGIEAVRRILDSSYNKAYHLEARSIGNVYAVDLIIGREAA